MAYILSIIVWETSHTLHYCWHPNHTHRHTHTHIIYIYICVCVCVCDLNTNNNVIGVLIFGGPLLICATQNMFKGRGIDIYQIDAMQNGVYSTRHWQIHFKYCINQIQCVCSSAFIHFQERISNQIRQCIAIFMQLYSVFWLRNQSHCSPWLDMCWTRATSYANVH